MIRNAIKASGWDHDIVSSCTSNPVTTSNPDHRILFSIVVLAIQFFSVQNFASTSVSTSCTVSWHRLDVQESLFSAAS